MTDPLYNAVHRIVHGQVRSYMNDHPETFMSGYRQHVANGIAKRIAGDLASEANRCRLAASLGPVTGEAVCECAEGTILTAQAGAGEIVGVAVDDPRLSRPPRYDNVEIVTLSLGLLMAFAGGFGVGFVLAL